MRPLVKWLSSPSSQAMADDWLLPVVHGYFRQRAVELSTGQVRGAAGQTAGGRSGRSVASLSCARLRSEVEES